MDPSDPRDVAAELRASMVLFVRKLRQLPVQDELTTPEMSALSRLHRAGSATPGELARAEGISPQGIGATLSALEQRGLVQRRPDARDRRRVVMSVTEAGTRVLDSKNSARVEQIGRGLSEHFTPEEIDILRAAAPLIARLGETIRRPDDPRL
jgi:DNA-binding MarR family transcriptional regulator